MKPIRIQRKRTKGWKMPANTVYVGRPTKWGNPFAVGTYAVAHSVKMFRELLMDLNSHQVDSEVYKRFQLMRDTIRDLEGKNLACWCKEGAPCHADALLELANAGNQEISPEVVKEEMELVG